MTPTPISAEVTSERIFFMDVLRGLALYGILMVNIHGFSFYYGSPHPWDEALDFAFRWLVEGKFYSLFSLLFGWGIALQIKRLNPADTVWIPGLLARRLALMMLFGAFHLVFIWSGDIVFLYSLVGFCFMLFWRVSVRRHLTVAAMCILAHVFLYHVRGLGYVVFVDWAYDTGQYLDELWFGVMPEEDIEWVVARGSWRDLFFFNLSSVFFRIGDLAFQDRFLKVLGVFLLGYSMGRTDFLKKLEEDPIRFKKLLTYCLGFGLVFNFFFAWVRASGEDYYNFELAGYLSVFSYAVGVVPLAFGYLLLLYHWHKKTPNWMNRWLAPLGRMAFSNYIGQSLLCILIFYGVGFGMLQTFSSWPLLGIATGIFILQVLFSRVWMTYFLFGPIEYVWRAGTYGKWPKGLKNDKSSNKRSRRVYRS